MTRADAKPSPTYRLRQRYHRVAERLSTAYGEPSRDPLPLGNRSDPLDELIYIILTVMTEFGVERTYNAVRERFPTWDDVLAAPVSALAEVLQPIGLSTQRATRIRALLEEIRSREGKLDLSRLQELTDTKVESYLCSLPGVGKKVARCVMLYSLGREVFPVDAHVLRVLKRLGLAEQDLTLQQAQDVLQGRVPEVLRYTLHVNLVVHGRAICRARKPKCDDCVLAPRCPSARVTPA